MVTNKKYVRKYTGYKDISSKITLHWNKNVDEIISKINFNHLLNYLCSLNYIIQSNEQNDYQRLDKSFINSLCSPKLSNNILKELNSNQLLHRKQILALIRKAFIFSSNNSKNFIKDDPDDFLSSFFQINDQLEETDENNNFYYSIIRTFYFDISDYLHSKIARNHIILKYLENHDSSGINFKNIFERVTDLTIDQYHILLYGIFFKYELLIKDKDIFTHPEVFFLNENYFKFIKKKYKNKVEILFKNISQSPSYFKDQLEIQENIINNPNFAINPFRKYPLCKIDNNYLLLDKKYLVEKITTGAFYIVLDKIKNDKKRQKLWHNYGLAFQHYCREIIEKTLTKSKILFTPKQLIPEEKIFSKKKTDYAIYIYPDTFIIFEFTIQSFWDKTVYNLDKQTLINNIEKILFGDSGKVYQFKSTEEWLLKNCAKKFGGVLNINKNIKTHRILVQQKQFPPFNSAYDQIYSKLFIKHFGKFDYEKDYIHFFNALEFESFIECIEIYEKPQMMLENYKNGEHLCFNNYLIKNKKSHNNSYLVSYLDSYFQNIKNELFNIPF